MYAMISIGFFYLLTFVLGFAAMVLVGQEPIQQIDASGNMAVLLLAKVWGGAALRGSIAAVFFVAVVAELTFFGATALSRDLWFNAVRHSHASESERLKVVRTATLLLGILAIMLAIAFKGQNVAVLIGLALAIAASANFFVLILSLLWWRFTIHGAVTSMVVSTVSSLGLIYFSPLVQVSILNQHTAFFPLINSGIVLIPLSLLVAIGVSFLTSESLAIQKFSAVEQRIYTREILGDRTSAKSESDSKISLSRGSEVRTARSRSSNTHHLARIALHTHVILLKR